MKNTKITCQKTTIQIIKIPSKFHQKPNQNIFRQNYTKNKHPRDHLDVKWRLHGRPRDLKWRTKSTSVASEARPRPAQGAFLTTSSSFLEFWDPKTSILGAWGCLGIDFGSPSVPISCYFPSYPTWLNADLSHPV